MPLDPSRRANLANWNDRVPIHAASATYDLDAFVADPQRLSTIVDFDRREAPDVDGRDLLHLQCHIGTDTLSWARLGARVTGYDFSGAALAVARDLAQRCGLAARFVEGEVYDAPRVFAGETFDVVYTGVGALNWLPDIRAWAQVVAAVLRPGGTLLLRDGHPMLWALDHDRTDDELVVMSPYFETAEPNRWNDPGTYTDDDAGLRIADTVTYEWNHGLAEIVTAVMNAGLVLRRLQEHREIEWAPWGLFEQDAETGRWVLPAGKRDWVPLMYTLLATRP